MTMSDSTTDQPGGNGNGEISKDDLAKILPKYELLEQAGRGAMGVVYRARHRLLDKPVAVKVCLLERFKSRFEREAKLMAQVAERTRRAVGGQTVRW
jgi:serine/threonine protein kinase